jgi:hypothetical protein
MDLAALAAPIAVSGFARKDEVLWWRLVLRITEM